MFLIKPTCLPYKISREVFSGILEDFSNSKISQYLLKKTKYWILFGSYGHLYGSSVDCYSFFVSSSSSLRLE